MPEAPSGSLDALVTPALDPIDVCTLEGEDLATRIGWVRRELAPHVLGRLRLPRGVALELSDAPGVAERVDHWIELERRCCGGIGWGRGVPSTPDRHRVEIVGVDPDGPLFAGFALIDDGSGAARPDDASAGLAVCDPKPRSAGWRRRLFSAGAAGTAASLLLCCLLPMGLTAAVGAGAGALTLSWLDDPRWIAFGAVLGAIVADRWRSARDETA